MILELTDDQKSFQATAQAFAREIVAQRAAGIDKSGEFPADVLHAAAAHGLLGVTIPRAWGGAGRDYVSYALAIEAIAKASATVAVSLSVTNSLVAEVIAHAGRDQQRERWLRPLAEGRVLGAFGLTEPDAGSDARGISTRAERRDGGWLINGQKSFISNAGTDMSFGVTLLARADSTDEEATRFGTFVVEKDTPGFTMGPKMRGIGWKGLDTRELWFDDVWVADEHLVGDPAMGLSQFLGTLEVGRISIAALSLSLTQAVLDLALAYAKQRQQFGQPISKFQAIQFKLADIATELEAARWLTYRAAYLRDAGQPFLKVASMAKLKASRVATWAASEAVQIHGGLGYMLETPVARFYCDAKVLEIGEGTNEIQHVVIARALGC